MDHNPGLSSSNTALCVGPKINYVALRTYNPYTGEPITAVLAEDLVGAYFKKEGKEGPYGWFQARRQGGALQEVGRWAGPELTGMHYAQLIPWVKPTEKLDDISPEYVRDYATGHPDKVYKVGKRIVRGDS